MNLKETLIFISYQMKNFLLYQRLIWGGKLRVVSVSSIFRVDYYAVAKEILVNKYCVKVKLRASIGKTQSSHCQRITPHRFGQE